MSTIKTLSRFYYGTTVTINNRSIDFSEGGPELRATLKVGTYSLTEYAAEWQRAMREAGSQAYVVSLNRSTQKITVSAPLNFSLLRATGSRIGTSAWSMSGFGSGADLTGTNSYLAANICGKRYDPQYVLSKYTSFEHSMVKENATVNITPTGLSQQAYFGDGSRCSMNITLITNKLGLKNPNFIDNPTGIENALDFMQYLITRGRVEFMPDKGLPNSFTKCFLESSKESRNGTEFELKNMGVPDFYETGDLVFRKVLV